ncbi:taste receptor type 2 member 40-like [Ambystoma mexicanum]|uniref:taste receptor type 2 member 40-like n=1 Tax=Ambystoma mexicanum TaxID=8296 RepID=UPI0037E97DF8
MLSFIEITEIVLNGLLCVMGVMANAFIVTVNFMTWMKRANEFNVSNVLISSLAVANTCLQCVYLAGTLLFVLWGDTFIQDRVFKTYMTLESFLVASSLWFSTWLSVYYCMKIVNCTHPSYVWIKARFPGIVPWLLTGSVLVSLASSMPVGCDIHLESTSKAPSNHSQEMSSNVSADGPITTLVFGSGCSTTFAIQEGLSFPAFLLLSSSAGAIMTSLYRHMRRMAQNADSFRSPDLTAHVGALKTVAMLLVLNVSSYVTTSIVYLLDPHLHSVGILICDLVIFAFPAMCAIILILGNSMLKAMLAKSFDHVKCCLGEGR